MKMKTTTPTIDYCPLCTSIETKKGPIILVDPEDWIKYGSLNWRLKKSGPNFYAIRKFKSGKKYKYEYMHRVITKCPKHMQVHHINGKTLDNRKENLEIIDPQTHRFLSRNSKRTE